jgi:hypothetical protein
MLTIIRHILLVKWLERDLAGPAIALIKHEQAAEPNKKAQNFSL